MVQRSAATLEQRWNQASFTMLHKIHNKQVNVDHSYLTTTRNKKILIPHSKTKHHMNSFFPRAIRLWNELPIEIKDAPTVPAFASGLNKFIWTLNSSINIMLLDWYLKLVILWFHSNFISKLLVLNCQCSGLAPALCSQYWLLAV